MKLCLNETDTRVLRRQQKMDVSLITTMIVGAVFRCLIINIYKRYTEILEVN